MSTPTEALWDIQPHTLAKHEIIRRYLGAWFPILGKYNQRVVYIDGFCGPGRYSKGEKGSPIIALESALYHQMQQRVREVTFVFIDKDKRRLEHLKKEIDSLKIPPTFHIELILDQFDNTIKQLLDDLDSRGTKLAPTFAFIDPFGFKGIPFNIIERLLQNEKTEVCINVMADSINRFLEHPDPQIAQQIEDVFGTPLVHQIISSGNRLLKLRELYQSQLRKSSKFVRYFEMRNENNRVIYYLFFATNNRVGHLKMKEAFWRVDPSTGYRFSDRTDPCQLVLFEMDPSDELIDDLLTVFSGKSVNVNTVQFYVEDKTPYTAGHMRSALKKLEKQGRINIESFQQCGKIRRKGTFPNGVVINFPDAN